MNLVTAWTALDNGCLWVVPSSHRGGPLDHSQAWMVDIDISKWCRLPHNNVSFSCTRLDLNDPRKPVFLFKQIDRWLYMTLKHTQDGNQSNLKSI